MKLLLSGPRWVFALLILLCTFVSSGAYAVPQFTGPQVLANNVNGLETGTDNTQFIFRCTIVPSDPATRFLVAPPRVIIDPLDINNPEIGGAASFPMVRRPANSNTFVAYVPGFQMNGGSAGNGQHTWSIVAQENNTDGVLMNGTGAAPKPAGNLRVVPSASPQTVEILPVVKQNGAYIIDKRINPGQLGNGLRLDPEDSTSANDGGSAHYYVWRVRVRTFGGLPLQFASRRTLQEWRDVRAIYDQAPPLVNRYNSGLLLVLIGPDGQRHLCPMEIDPDAPNGLVTQTVTHTTDTQNPNTLLHPTAPSDQWATAGVYYRYRMLATQYQFNWGPLPGEGPYTAFTLGTQPDLLPGQPIGYQIGQGSVGGGLEVVGRPFANQYTAFAGPDRTSPMGQFAPPFPFYTNTAGRAGQWSYFYQATTDLRPPNPGGGLSPNGNINTYPVDLYGADLNGYISVIDSDTGLAPGSANTPYRHPFVTPILSDGGWSDDIPENGYPSGVGGNAHRSRVTSKTRVRFECRVTKADNSPLPAQAVRVFIDNVPFTMTQLQVAGNNDFLQGIVFIYDTTFGNGNQVGQHRIYFEVDDGIHKSIWPRRDWGTTPPDGTGDVLEAGPRYPLTDPQSLLAPYGLVDNTPVNFGTTKVGKNYLTEPLVNSRPVLTAPLVTPPSGANGQPFTYEITYSDADNDKPLDADVVIDSVPHRMTLDPADVNKPTSQGVRYRFVTTLIQTPDNKHTYYFKFRDNWNRLQAYGVSDIRREYGEWTSFPAGDDNGVPSFEITGPTIIQNNKPELTDPGYTFSDPAQTPATLYDFTVRYRDADNEAPATLTLYLSTDGGATYDGGTAMVPAESSTNYISGVQYHLAQRIQLRYSADNKNPPAFNYRYKFVANDGKHDVVADNTTLIHVGTGSTAAADGSAHQLFPVDNTNLVFGDPNSTLVNPSTKDWVNLSFFIWTKNGNVFTPVFAGPTTYSIDFVDGTVHFVTVPTGTVYASYFYLDTVGPTIHPNRAPQLTAPTPGDPATNDGTLSPLQGSPTTTFTYSVIYTDPDNQPPLYVNVIIDNVTTPVRTMIMDPSTPTPIDYTKGVKFTYTTTLGVGPHNYHFEASDGADVVRLPIQGASPSDFQGPTVTDPTNLQTPLVNPSPKGKHDDAYTFTVTYKNPSGNAPPQGGIEVRLIPVAPLSPGQKQVNILLNPIDPIGPTEYMNGVRYQVQDSVATNPALVPGLYNVVFGFVSSPLSGTAPIALTINGQPVLSNPTATPPNNIGASQAGDIALSVTYTDVNGDPPQNAGGSTIKLYIDGAVYVAVNPTTTPATPTAADFKAGVVYTWTIQAKDLTVGVHKFYFSAADDLENANPFNVPAPPGADFTIKAAQKPTLANGAVTPTSGSKGTQYTYSVTYTHGDNVTPASIKVFIDPGTPNAKTIDLTPTAGQQLPLDYANGVNYSYTTTAGELASGSHTFYFEAQDRLVTVTFPANAPTTTLPGPTVNFVPTLTGGTVYLQGATTFPTITAQNALQPPVKGSTLTNFIFQVTYTDPDFVANSAPVVTVTVTNADNTTKLITLKPKPGSAQDAAAYAAGVIYTNETNPGGGDTLTAGAKTFHFDATDTQDPARLPATGEISGLTVANLPVLTAPNATGDDGTLSPRVGPLSTTFTYKIVYSNADGTAPAFVNVILDEGLPTAKTIAMQKAGTTTNYVTGVTYQAQYRFQSGDTHTYRFEAADTVTANYVAKFPATGSLSGPSINLPNFAPITFNPVKPIIGQQVTISSQLFSSATTAQQIAVQLVKPDGSGSNFGTTTDAAGQFTYQFTPDQTGDWTVRFSWAGITGVADSVTAEAKFKVGGYTISLPGGALDMIASPLIPVTPDPTISFGLTAADGITPLAITHLNLIKWVPSASGARYFSLNQDGNFPNITGGQSYWVHPDQSVVINPTGKLWDQTQPYTIPLVTGWNMIGSVYLNDINWSAVKVRSNGQLINLADAGSLVRPIAWTYNKSTGGYDLVTLPNGVLQTGRGYWVRAFQNVDLVIAPPGVRSVVEGRDAVEMDTSLQIAAKAGDRVDQWNFAPLTSSGNSRLALMEKPPYVGSYVTVRFLPTESITLPADSRAAANNASNVVAFEVETDKKNTDVSVYFPNMSTLGRKTEVTLVDISNGTRRSLGTSSGVTYNTGENTGTRRFALIMNTVVANSRLVINNLHTVGGRGVNGVQQFTFDITSTANFRAQIIGGAGNTVLRNLETGRAATVGSNNLMWDGKDGKGVPVAAGSYTLKLTASDDKGRSATATTQIIVVR